MNLTLRHDRQLRSIGIALFASILAAVATMLVPVAILESITGATGLSELVPATAAPLGDTARAAIAFSAGALTLALMALLLLRQRNGGSMAADAGHIPEAGMPENDDDSFVASFTDRLTRLRMPKMPWDRAEDDITDLADLPRLRGGDAHPDAPPRRPLLATQDLPVLDLMQTVAENEPPVVPAAAAVEPAKIAEPGPVEAQPTLAEMVAQLEASVAQRQQQLAELEIVAARLAATKNAEAPVAITAEPVETPSPPTEPTRLEWPPLEAVPADDIKPDDMDEALAAALATLQRMNGTSR